MISNSGYSPSNCSTSSINHQSTTRRRILRPTTPSSPILLLAFCCCAALLLLVTSPVRGADSDSSSTSSEDSDEFDDDMCECGPRCAGYQSVELCARCCSSVMRRKRFVPWQSSPSAASVVKPSSLDASLTRRRAAPHSSTVTAAENGEPVEERAADYLPKKVGSTKRGAQTGRTLGRNVMSLMRLKL